MSSMKDILLNAVKSGVTITAAATILGTGSYVLYKDNVRYKRMMSIYARGNLLPPLAENHYEIKYCRRPDLEEKLRHTLSNTFSNEYYLVKGEVGTGKTRTIVEMVRELMKTNGEQNDGAPVYVLASQGRCFSDVLASTVQFYFDEHISFRFFLDLVFKVHSLPGRDEHHKLHRTLGAIEKSAFRYMENTGKPVVLVIDGATGLSKRHAGALEALQAKAKLWADTNIVKVIFVCNDEETEDLLKVDTSNWSRAGAPVRVGDLTQNEALQFLTRDDLMEKGVESLMGTPAPLPKEEAEKIFDIVGGRIHNLISFKRDWIRGVPLDKTVIRMKEKEREKFLKVCKTPSSWKAVGVLNNSPDKAMHLSKLVEATSVHDVHLLAENDVVKLERDPSGMLVKFESKLTEQVAGELSVSYAGK